MKLKDRPQVMLIGLGLLHTDPELANIQSVREARNDGSLDHLRGGCGFEQGSAGGLARRNFSEGPQRQFRVHFIRLTPVVSRRRKRE